MPYTEIKSRNNKKYYYRTTSFRQGNKIKKKRVYLGAGLLSKELAYKETEADDKINSERINKNLSFIKNKIIKVLKKYNVKKAGIFGSYVRGDNTKKSDIDIVIEPPKRIGLGFVSIALELEDKLGRKVDLLSYNGIHPLLKKRILREEKLILNG